MQESGIRNQESAGSEIGQKHERPALFLEAGRLTDS